MSNLAKGLILLLVVLGVGAGLVVWKNKVGGTHATGQFNSISREEVEMLLADVAKVNPMVLKRFAEDPEMKKQQLDNLKQLLAFASEAKKEGLADEPTNKQELDNIRAEVVAVNYDKEINKGKGPMPPFGFITEDQVKAFWTQGGSGSENDFQKFLDAKVASLKLNEPAMKDREVTDEEKLQARDFFAKIGIYNKEYNSKAAAGLLPLPFRKRSRCRLNCSKLSFWPGAMPISSRQRPRQVTPRLQVTSASIRSLIFRKNVQRPRAF